MFCVVALSVSRREVFPYSKPSMLQSTKISAHLPRLIAVRGFGTKTEPMPKMKCVSQTSFFVEGVKTSPIKFRGFSSLSDPKLCSAWQLERLVEKNGADGFLMSSAAKDRYRNRQVGFNCNVSQRDRPSPDEMKTNLTLVSGTTVQPVP